MMNRIYLVFLFGVVGVVFAVAFWGDVLVWGIRRVLVMDSWKGGGHNN